MSKTERLKSAKKYSNIKLFEKREKEFKLKQLKKLNYPLLKKILKTKTNSTSHVLSTSTTYLDSEVNQLTIRKKFLKNIKLKKNLINNKKSLDKYTEFNNEKPLIKTYRQNSSYNIFHKTFIKLKKNKNKSLNNSNIISNSKNNNYLLINNYSNVTNADILLHFESERNLIKNYKNKKISENKNTQNIISIKKKKLNRINSDINDEKILNYKIKQINLRKENKTKYLNKTIELKILKYTSKMKNDGITSLKDNYQNNIDYYNDKYQSLLNTKKILELDFIDKLTDFVKFINMKKESEKKNCSLLISSIIKYKNDINYLNQKIRKKNLEKNNILKWIYFQIQIKEKKLCLPSYYRTIIENNIIKKNKKGEELSLGDRGRRMSCVGRFSKKEIRIYYLKDIRSTKKHLTKKRQFKIQSKEFNSENGLFFNCEIDLNDPVNFQEINKIKNYKNNLIYCSVEELKNVFIFFENKIIAMMEYAYNLRKKIFYIKKELLNIINYTKKNDIIYNNSLKIKQDEINKLNDEIKAKLRFKQNINTNNNDKILLNNSKKSYSYKFKLYYKNRKNTNLFNKINMLYKTCQLLGLNFEPETNKKNENKDKKIRKVLYELKYINFTVHYLLSKFAIYNSNNYEKKDELNKLKYEIENNNKIKKAEEQRIQIEEKIIKMKNKIEERNNKVYFLTYRKIEHYRSQSAPKKQNDNNKNNESQNIQIYDLIS